MLLVIPPILVLHRAILVHRLERRAQTDAKTGLLNASAWTARAGRALRAAEDEATAAGLLILDLDHFKAVNDTYGHLAGDDVLGAVADALHDEVREQDLVGRFGGEEFVVLLPRLGEGDEQELRRIAERIRRRVRSLEVPAGGRRVSGVTTSIGAAVHPTDGSSLNALVATADAALYLAKQAGRDSVRTGADVRRGDGPDGGT